MALKRAGVELLGTSIVAPLAGGLLGALVHRAPFVCNRPIAPRESAVEAEG